MDRRRFIKYAAVPLVLPHLELDIFVDDFDVEAITGLKPPELIGSNYKLRKDAAQSFDAMSGAALMEGFKIRPVSSYRSFNDQKRIWNSKYQQFTTEDGLLPQQAILKIIEYSTIPGTSRHHWGTDIDIVDGNRKVEGDVLVSHLFQGDGPFAAFKSWLNTNASRYNFIEVYTSDQNRKGFKYEPWHFSYAPLSIKILKIYQEIDFIKLLKSLSIHGNDYFTNEFIGKYWDENVLDINPILKGK
ncbi:MAG: M15 family metallopeptidase [Bacteroidetes bacterium]|nr:M15 family metallopeptidase [Bacteroidota bacterium]MDA1121210.1 M15 family metallopeptidase [Bacteroidota bacterium]